MSKPESPRVLRIESVDDDMAAVLRLKTPAERLQIAFGMIDSAIYMLRHMLADQHPDWPAEKIQAEVARRISHGDV